MENKIQIEENENVKNIKKIAKGSIISIVITLVFLLVYSILLTYTDIPENTIPIVLISVTAISIFIGSFLSTTHMKKNGILNGGAVGLIYIIFLYIVSSFLITNFYINVQSIIMILSSLALGMVGGIIGVNKSK